MSTQLFGTNVDALRLPTIPLQPAGVPNRPTIQPLRREVGGREKQFFQALSTLNHNLNAYIDRYEDERQNPYSEENMKALAKLQSMSPQELKAASLENSTSGIWVREQLNNRLLADNALNEFRKSFAPLESQSFDPKQGGIEATYDTMAKHFADGLPNSMAQNMFYSQLHEHRTRTILEYNQRKNEYAKGQMLSVIHDRIGQDVQDARKQNLSPIGIAQLMIENTSKYANSYHMTSPERDSSLLKQVQDLIKEGHIAEAKAILDHPLTDDEGKLSVPLGQNVQYKHYTDPLYGAIYAKEALDTHQKAKDEAFQKAFQTLQNHAGIEDIHPTPIPNEKGTGFTMLTPSALIDGAGEKLEESIKEWRTQAAQLGMSDVDIEKEAFAKRLDFYTRIGRPNKDWQGQFDNLLTRVTNANGDANPQALKAYEPTFELAYNIASLNPSYLPKLIHDQPTSDLLDRYITERTHYNRSPEEAMMNAIHWMNLPKEQRQASMFDISEVKPITKHVLKNTSVEANSINSAIIEGRVMNERKNGYQPNIVEENATHYINSSPKYNGVVIENHGSDLSLFKGINSVVETELDKATKEERVNVKDKPQVSLDNLYVKRDPLQPLFYIYDKYTGTQINVTPITESDLRKASQQVTEEETARKEKAVAIGNRVEQVQEDLQQKDIGELLLSPYFSKNNFKEQHEQTHQKLKQAREELKKLQK
ncbi:hypothetical protein [Bartonella sp. DGB2]|uniref:hypothetical protein n=1 Tax=Bartonella sp. DGB2 TaxID=3388426 RepID=UPI00398FBF49